MTIVNERGVLSSPGHPVSEFHTKEDEQIGHDADEGGNPDEEREGGVASSAHIVLPSAGPF